LEPAFIRAWAFVNEIEIREQDSGFGIRDSEKPLRALPES